MRLWATVVALLLAGLSWAAETTNPATAPAGTTFKDRVISAGQRYNPQVRAHQTNYPLAELARRKLMLLQGFGPLSLFGQNIATAIEREGQAALERMERYKSYFATPGELSELAYFTGNDGTAQPYYLYLPPGYHTRQKWPLIVFLHGYVPTISILDPWVPSPEQCAVAGRNGCMLVVPYARRNTDFQGVGEVDVLAVLDEVQRLYPVDPERVYLSGVSMGGMGTWTIGLRHPGRFAALTPMCGQTDMFLWWGWPREDTPAWKRWLIEWDNAVDLAPNLTAQNVFVQHGERDDLIPAEQSRMMVQLAQQQGTPIRYHEFAGQSHYIYWDLPVYENAWSWSKDQRLIRRPKEVRLKCFSLEYNRAHWLTIEQLEQWGTPGEVTASVLPGGTGLRLTTRNVRLLKVDVTEAPLQNSEDFTVILNGQREVCRATANGELYVSIGTPLESPGWPPLKRKGLCGPAEEVFDTRFLVVQGTAGDSAQDTTLARQVAKWCEEWDAFADGLPPVKTDVEVTPEDVRECNLILFGTPQTNSVLARLADRLPVQIADHHFTVAGQTYEGPDLGLVLCYPNPLNPSRYVLIYSGEFYGERLSINHKHDLLPDFIVFTTRAFARDDANQWLCAGFFDMDWKLKPALTWRQEPTW
jgi:hypothetical protein